jgi:ABC-type polysaccharide/polyol phosphate transport system ATPase subunit
VTALVEMHDVGVRAIEVRIRQRRSSVPSLLGKVKHNVWPIRHLDFTMEPGETVFVANVGGSRPAVLFRVVCGLIDVDEGSVVLPRRTVLSNSESRAKLLRALSLEQAIRMMAGLLGMPDRGIDRRFDDIVEFAEAGRKLHVTVDSLPRQLLQQAAFSVAVHVPADLYTFDGTALIGSAEFRAKSAARLAEMAGAGKGLMIHARSLKHITPAAERGLILDGDHPRVVPIAEFSRTITAAQQEAARKSKRRRRRRDD